MLKFRNKWGQRYCAPGGKVQFDETPSESTVREFAEETGLHLHNPTLRGIARWIDTDRQQTGIIFNTIVQPIAGFSKHQPPKKR